MTKSNTGNFLPSHRRRISSRRAVQLAFLILIVVGVFGIDGHVEAWCPFGGVEALYTYLKEGNLVCSLGVSNFYILAGLLVSVLLLRRAFCGYVCPIGAVSEWTRKVAQALGIGAFKPPHVLDSFLSLLKFVILAAILCTTWKAGELIFRGFDPFYALISRHGEDITYWAYVVSGGIIVSSIFLSVPFCRWLCPLAAVLNPFSRFGIFSVQRKAEYCQGCRNCARVCPMVIPVDELQVVRQARCTSCLDCIDACPERDRGALVWGLPNSLGNRISSAFAHRHWYRLFPVSILILTAAVSVSAWYLFPLPSFISTHGDLPPRTESFIMKIQNLRCRGQANLLVFYLRRDDELGISGYLRFEAWPRPKAGKARIVYDPACTDPDSIKQAICEPYFDLALAVWRIPPFEVEAYDPLR